MCGGKTFEQIQIVLRDRAVGRRFTVYADVYDNSLAHRWLAALNLLLDQNYHLEKNYCWFGWTNGARDGNFILEQINQSVAAINASDLGYTIPDHFTMANCLMSGPVGEQLPGRRLIHEKMNNLHRYFEDLQGVSNNISDYALRASPSVKWHIRQLNLLCHEFESWALSWRKLGYAPQWRRPSQLMCWLNAPRFLLEPRDFELFGINSINRNLGGIYVGVNKAVGKHHWEVFQDEGRDSRIDELTTSTLRSQTQAAGDFDIEWAQDTGNYVWQQKALADFVEWLERNGFDPQDPSLTLGHPKVAQVDLLRSFGTTDAVGIWYFLANYLDVWSIRTSQSYCEFPYHWSDSDYQQKQIDIIGREP